jgi:hypothetical protein
MKIYGLTNEIAPSVILIWQSIINQKYDLYICNMEVFVKRVPLMFIDFY